MCDSGEKVTIIDVGCGTGHTTIALGKRLPDVSFLGIDTSKQSIEQAKRQAGLKNVTNVSFKHRNCREDLSLLGTFEIALCLGVLHHIEDAERSFRNIVQIIKPQGYCVLWLYGRMGRFKHSMNQEFLRLLSKDNEPNERLDLARTFLQELGPRFVRDTGFYTPKGSEEAGLAWLLGHPEWLADQMIPAYERCVDLADVLHLFNDNGLVFWKWFGIPSDLKKYTSSTKLLERFGALSCQDQLLAMDYLLKPSYYFVVGKKTKVD